ncbi:hypothetical protein [Meiothermus granaticius]|uniref:Uncharacterized protein n=1 Tax=Meiothermus granaticius NBRC 107808 TaxID=1227551 RepID=A0A399FBZ5_9DEIN|nr:hypothetical protein [Meiothermus granaticius]MCL6525587.1 hypothetical protein [Thermaceae bacterium]RIH93693.1 hypothetical protein Mgrana_00276 [Meiothermus granaticius NBRC 107808]GEM85783.1 hypothetical protein MGR01S_04080 [Meiothermus granaticius NBRC 107808]
MKRERVVLLGGQVVIGEEIEPSEFPDLETFRRQAARWEGPENVLVMRNARIERGAHSERLDYLLLKRDEIKALGIGLGVEGLAGAGLER